MLSSQCVRAAELNLVTDRTDFHLKPLIAQFQQQTGIKVNKVNLDQGGIPARLASGADSVDLVISTDSVVLEQAHQRGWTTNVPKELLQQAVDSMDIPVDATYVPLSYRGRVLVYAPDRVNLKDLTGYADLADPRYRGRVCIRPLTHAYNINLVSQMLVDNSEKDVARWLSGVQANLAVTPSGNDRYQAQLVAKGVCDIAVINTYYYGLMMSNPAERQWATKLSLFFPEQQGRGTYVLVSGAAFSSKAKNINEAVQFVKFLLSPIGQSYATGSTYEYPAVRGTDLPVMLSGFGDGQVKDGKAKFYFVDPVKVSRERERASQLITSTIR